MRRIDVSKKNIDKIKLESEKCVGCNQCLKGCPMLEKFCDSPGKLLNKIIEEKQIDYQIPYSCFLCGYCTMSCHKNVDLAELFLSLREDIVKETKGKLPKELGYNKVKFHQKSSFSKIFSTDIENPSNESSTIFFPGCSLMGYSPDVVEKTYRYLRSNINGLGIYLTCCGKPTHSMGYTKDFNRYYNDLRDEFNNKKIKKVITACSNCFNTIKDNSKDIEVISLWEVIDRIGVPKNIKGRGKNIEATFSIHDPCPTRNERELQDSIRNILKDIELKVNEMNFSKEKTLCCGSGGMTGVTNITLAQHQMKKRANESKEEYIVTYCEECVESMKRGGKKSLHILDLLFNEDIYSRLDQQQISIMKKWTNRYKGKKLLKNFKDDNI